MKHVRPAPLLLVIALAACSGGSQPAGPTPPTTPPSTQPPVAVATPTPVPTPTPQRPAATKCTLNDSHSANCQKEKRPDGSDRTIFYEDIQRGIRELRTEKPGLFNGHRIRNERTFMAGIYLKMQELGYCSWVGPSPDELTLKRGTNTWSETYDMIFAEGKTPTTDYMYTCRPAQF
jgi:hypothetical protein